MKRKSEPKKPGPREAELKARHTVLNMLSKDGSPIRWTMLEGQARKLGMSLRTLRKRLTELELQGRVRRVVKAEERPPGVYYILVDPELFKGIYDALPPDLVDLNLWMRNLEKLRGHPAQVDLAYAIIKMQLFIIEAEIIEFLGKALTLPSDEVAVDFIRTMNEDYILPATHNLGLLLRVHENIAEEVLDRALDECLENAKDVEKSLRNVMGEL